MSMEVSNKAKIQLEKNNVDLVRTRNSNIYISLKNSTRI